MGKIGLKFERKRRKKRLENLFLYAKESLKTLFKGTEIIRNIEIEIHKENYQWINENHLLHKNFVLSPKPFVELFFLNIPSLWGKNLDIWSEKTNYPLKSVNHYSTPLVVCDSRLEVFSIPNIKSYILNILGIQRKISKIAQLSGVRIKFHNFQYLDIMIDGEFYHFNSIHLIQISPSPKGPLTIMCTNNSRIAKHQ